MLLPARRDRDVPDVRRREREEARGPEARRRLRLRQQLLLERSDHSAPAYSTEMSESVGA